MITKEDFSKLKQLDRIEYRQKREIIDDSLPRHNTSTSVYLSLFLILSVMIIDMWTAMHTGFLYSSEMYKNILVIIVAYITAMFCLDLYCTYLFSKNIKQLNKEYFIEKIEVKK